MDLSDAIALIVMVALSSVLVFVPLRFAMLPRVLRQWPRLNRWERILLVLAVLILLASGAACVMYVGVVGVVLAGRMIVVTMRDPHAGKRFAFYAEERGGVLTWGCRTIDLESKYLPGSCR